MKLFYFVLPIIFQVSCSNKDSNLVQSKATVPEFDFNSSIYKSIDYLPNSDTITILANLSACTSWRYEKNILTKNDSGIFIETYADGEFVDSNEMSLEKVKYSHVFDDSLTFENLFQHLKNKGIEDEKINSRVFRVIYKTDTVQFYSKGLGDHLENIRYYKNIKQRLYPNANLYKPITIPPRKIADS